MPLRPFPYPLRVGVDVCYVSRIRRVIAPKEGDGLARLYRFIHRVLTKPERLYFWDRFGPEHNVQTKIDVVSEYLAGRFAAKEAIRKAANHFHKDTRGLREIMILPITVSNRSEKQSVAPQGLILDRKDHSDDPTSGLAESQSRNIDAYDGQLCEISISHDNDLATAVALVPSMQTSTNSDGK